MSATPPAALLLHAGGWDELIYVAAGLLIAWAVISLTGRRPPDEVETEEQAAVNEDEERAP